MKYLFTTGVACLHITTSSDTNDTMCIPKFCLKYITHINKQRGARILTVNDYIVT